MKYFFKYIFLLAFFLVSNYQSSSAQKIAQHHFSINVYPEFQLRPKVNNNTEDYYIHFKPGKGVNFGFLYSLVFNNNMFVNIGMNLMGASMKSYRHKFLISKAMMSQYILYNDAYKKDMTFNKSKLVIDDRFAIPITVGYKYNINDKLELMTSMGVLMALHFNEALYDGTGEIMDDGDSVRTYISYEIEGKSHNTLAFGYYPALTFHTSLLHKMKYRNAFRYFFTFDVGFRSPYHRGSFTLLPDSPTLHHTIYFDMRPINFSFGVTYNFIWNKRKKQEDK